MKTGPIILVEDDVDDQEFIVAMLTSIGVKNEILIFENGKKAFDFLRSTPLQPFIIISDINLPLMDGLQLKKEIQEHKELHQKAIPFVFLTTGADAKYVKEAYALNAQGFFVKETSVEAIQNQLSMIINYWKICRHPNANV